MCFAILLWRAKDHVGDNTNHNGCYAGRLYKISKCNDSDADDVYLSIILNYYRQSL